MRGQIGGPVKPTLLAIACAWIAACSSTPTARVHPEWKQRSALVHTVLIAPPRVVLYTPDAEESTATLDPQALLQMKTDLMTAAEEALRECGLTSARVPVGDPGAEGLSAGYERAIDDVYREREDFETPQGEKATCRVSVGAAAGALSPGLQAEALLCVQVSGLERSFGGWFSDTLAQSFKEDFTLGIANAVAPAPGQTLSPHTSYAMQGCTTTVSLVDRRTGQLLWTDREGREESLSASAAASQLRHLIHRLSVARAAAQKQK